jgi:hypothetical protein
LAVTDTPWLGIVLDDQQAHVERAVRRIGFTFARRDLARGGLAIQP